MRTLRHFAASFLLTLCAFALSSGVAQAQTQQPNGGQLQQAQGVPWQVSGVWTFSAGSSPTPAFNVKGMAYWQIQFVPSGTINTCNVSLDSSINGGASFTTGGILPSSTIGSCATPTTYSNSTPTSPTLLAQLTPTITGTGSVTVTLFGYINNPGAAGSSSAAITSPLDGTGNVKVNCEAGCAGSNPNGQAAMANSSPVVIASNQAAIPVTTGQIAETTASWTNATAVNTVLQQNILNYAAVDVTLNQGSGITGGAVNFEASDTTAFTNAYPINCSAINSFAVATTYTLVASVNQAYNCDVSGFLAFRVRLTTVISGSGTLNLGIASSAMPAVPDVAIGGTVISLLEDGSGNSISSTGGALNINASTAGTTGTAVPAKGQVIAGKNGSGNTQDVATDSSGNVGVNIQNTPTVQATGHAGAAVDAAAGAAAAANSLQAGAVYNTSPPVPSNGQQEPLQLDSSANLKVNCATGCAIGSNTPADSFANPTNAAPSQSFPEGWNGSNWDRQRTATIGNAVAPTGIFANSPYCEYLSSLPTLTTGTYGAVQCDSSGRMLVNISNSSLAMTQSGSWNVGQSGSWTVTANAGTGTFNIQANASTNTNQWAGSSLGAPSNYGTSPGAVLVPGVNAYITNNPAVAQSGAWSVRTNGNTGAALDAAAGASAAPNSLQAGGVYNSAAPALSNGQQEPLQLDASANLKVNCTAGCANGSNTPADSFANPSNASPSQNFLQGWNGSAWDRLRTATIGNAVAATGLFASSPYCEYLLSLPNLTTGTYGAAQCDSNGRLLVDISNSSLAVTQSGGWNVGQSGSWTVTANAGTGTFNIQANASTNTSEWGGSALGAPSNYGTSPGAVLVPGVNAYITNNPAVAQSGPWSVRANGNSGAALDAAAGASAAPNSLQAGAVYNSSPPAPSSGQQEPLQIDASSNLRTTGASEMAGTTPGTAPPKTAITGGIYNTSPPAPTNGQTVPFQLDPAGRLIVNVGNDPCQTNPRSIVPISQTSSGTLINGTSGKKTYVCFLQFSISATADNIALVEGTGTNCATGIAGMAGGTTAATGWNLLASGSVTGGSISSWAYSTATAGDNVCLLTSSASQVSGVIQYVQQ